MQEKGFLTAKPHPQGRHGDSLQTSGRRHIPHDSHEFTLNRSTESELKNQPRVVA